MRKSNIFSMIIFMVSMAFTACSQDDLPNEDSLALPERVYPLEIGSAEISVQQSEQPWTRVTESANSSTWQDGDQIGVRLGSDSETGIYSVNVSGSNVTITPVDTVYWKSTSGQTVTAWYPITSGTLNLSEQSNGLSTIPLKGTGTATFGSAVNLSFSHSLAKVRLSFTGSGTNKVQRAEVYNYGNCGYEEGEISVSGEKVWIPIPLVNSSNYWEAYVVPGEITSNNFIRINGGDLVNISNLTKLEAGHLYTITVSVN